MREILRCTSTTTSSSSGFEATPPDGYRIATAPELNSSRLTSFKSTRFDSPANNVGPWPASLGCTMISYSSIKSQHRPNRIA
jgi:hypothetical protein